MFGCRCGAMGAGAVLGGAGAVLGVGASAVLIVFF